MYNNCILIRNKFVTEKEVATLILSFEMGVIIGILVSIIIYLIWGFCRKCTRRRAIIGPTEDLSEVCSKVLNF